MTFELKYCDFDLQSIGAFVRFPLLYFLFYAILSIGLNPKKMTDTEETTPEEQVKYELMLILQPDLGEDVTQKELDEIRGMITHAGGEIFHEDIWGVQEMSYTIKKQTSGYYIVFNTTLNPSMIKELENTLNIHQPVLRYLLVHTPGHYQIKTFKEYQADAEVLAKQAQEEKDEKKAAMKRRKSSPKKEEAVKEAPVKKEEPVKKEKVEKVEKEEKVVVEEEEVPEKKTPKEEKANLDAVDEKLKNIINDPDISL